MHFMAVAMDFWGQGLKDRLERAIGGDAMKRGNPVTSILWVGGHEESISGV